MTDYDQLLDVQLVAACRSGDELAWDALVGRYERLVYTVPSRYGLTQTEIDDVFQSVWLSLLKNLDKLREPDRISAWLVTTARRECWERRRGADYKRSVSTDLESLVGDQADQEQPPEEVVARYREHEALRAAIDRLEERCQNILWHLYFDATIPSYADVADKLDMPIGSIGPIRARCIQKLRALMAGLNNEDDVSES